MRNLDLGGSINGVGWQLQCRCWRFRIVTGIPIVVVVHLMLRYEVFQYEKPGESGREEDQNHSQWTHFSLSLVLFLQFRERKNSFKNNGISDLKKKGILVVVDGSLIVMHKIFVFIYIYTHTLNIQAIYYWVIDNNCVKFAFSRLLFITRNLIHFNVWF